MSETRISDRIWNTFEPANSLAAFKWRGPRCRFTNKWRFGMPSSWFFWQRHRQRTSGLGSATYMLLLPCISASRRHRGTGWRGWRHPPPLANHGLLILSLKRQNISYFQSQFPYLPNETKEILAHSFIKPTFNYGSQSLSSPCCASPCMTWSHTI